MAKIVVDFNNKIIDVKTRVWVAFPGNGYRLISDFTNASVVYPDVLNLPDDEKVFDDTRELARILARSEKIRDWHRRRAEIIERPSMNLNDYSNSRWNKSRDNTRGIIKGYFQKAEKGDLVVTPGPGGYLGRSYVGELTSEATQRLLDKTPLYSGEVVLARKVRWLSSFDNSQLPSELLKRLLSPVGFSLLERSFYRQIYARAYKSFTFDGEFASVISTDSAKYTSVHALHIDLISNYSAGILEAIDGSPEDIRSFFAKEYLEAAFSKTENDYVSELNIAVASPGKIRQYAKKLTPILTNTFLKIGLISADDLKAADIEFTNSANGGHLDDNDLKVKEGAEKAVALMDLASLKKLCKSAAQANASAELTNSVSAQQAAE